MRGGLCGLRAAAGRPYKRAQTQNQNDYNRRYDEAVSRFEAAKAERDAFAAEIPQRGIRRREFDRFISTLESLPDQVTDFSEDLWGSLVEYLTVYTKDDLRFMLPCEVEMEV